MQTSHETGAGSMLDKNSLEYLFQRPAQVQLDITNECNLKCFYCYNSTSQLKEREMTDDELRKVSKKIAEQLNPVSVLFSGGEPFKRPAILLELLRFFKEKGIEARINTNGTLITEDLVKALMDADVDKVSINIESMDPSAHDRIRGIAGSYKAAMEALGLFKKYRMNSKVSISIVVSKMNLHDIEKVAEFVKENGFMSLHLLDMIPLSNTSMQHMLSKEDWLYFEEIFKKINRIGIGIEPNHALLFLKGFESSLPMPFCMAGRLKMVISVNGSIVPCNYFREKEFVAGNALKDDLMDVWKNSEMMIKFRNFYPHECRSCPNGSYCAGGCRALSYVLSKDAFVPDPYCSKYSLGKKT